MDHDGNGFVEVSTQPLLVSPAIISNADVTSGTHLNFRYRAQNVHGWSEYSDEFVIVASTIPNPPTNIATISTFVSSAMTLQWLEPANTGGNAVAITAYKIEVQHYDQSTMSAVPAGCAPDSAEVVASQSCQVEMSLLRADPFFLSQGDGVKIRVAALNLVGWSDWSAINTVVDGIALMEDIPHKPYGPPTRDDIQTSDLLLQVDWAAFNSPENGGATITSYNLQYDDSSDGNIWTDLTGILSEEVVFSFGVTESISKGQIYKFRYRAKNAHGWGAFSDELELIGARRTDQQDPVVTSNEGTDVRISWTEPAYDGGTPLLGYRVTIKTHDGFFVEDLVNCEGAD